MRKILLFLSISGLLIGCTTTQDENPQVFTSENSYEVKFFTENKLKIDPDKHLNKQLTYLTGVLQSFKESEPAICQQISTIIAADSYSYEKELLKKEPVKNRINTAFNDNAKTEDFLEKLNTLIQENKIEMVDKLCIKGKNIYVTLPSGTNKDNVIYIAKWQEDSSAFTLLKGIEGTADLYYTFVPEFSEGKHLVETGYGDAGQFWWQFDLLDEKTQNYEEVEYCQGNYVYDDVQGNFKKDEFEYKCEKEFRPLNK